MSFTKPVFTHGLRYRVKRSFKSGPTSEFREGEVLIFERDGYSPYDNSFVYEFRTEKGAYTKEWWLSEAQPKESWRQYFEILLETD